MMDFLFFVKSVALAIVLVLFMQIEVGQKPLEIHAQQFIKSAAIVEPVHLAAQGGAKLIRDTSARLTERIWRKKEEKGKAGEPAR